jgi:hypothetical protein
MLRDTNWPSWLWRWVPRWTVGFWYKPLRLFAPLGVLLGVSWALFSWANAMGAMRQVGTGRDTPVFRPLAYSAELLIPVVKIPGIHQTELWQPSPDAVLGPALLLATWLLSMAGWVILALVTERIAKPLFRR